MARVKRGKIKRKKHKKVLKQAKGSRGAKKALYRQAKENMERALAYATRDRRVKKRQFRRLWITNLSIALRNMGMRYSEFIKKLKEKNILLSRPMLYKILLNRKEDFKKIVEAVK
ncbi:MAG: 50S ribosomal protein L20 [Elusimicrobia bacterium]|nr:50S ribosomal protein L20 [Elusimicrobiota bacterium]